MKKRTLQEAKDLLNLWHILRLYVLSGELIDPCICLSCINLKQAGIFNRESQLSIKRDMFSQSLDNFSPEYRSEVLRGRKYESSGFLFSGFKSRLKFINKRIERLQAEVLKLQSNE